MDYAAPAFDEDDVDHQARAIEECLQLFQNRDFIMEPSVFPTLQRFFEAGGTTDKIVEPLALNYHAIAQTSNLLAEWLLMTNVSLGDVQSAVENNLKNMIIKYFDPKKADTIFSDETSGTPAWLTEMIGHPTWRNLIYKLAEDYPECLMLTFTVKLISDAGFQSEITSISTASQQLEVFSRILKTSINTFLDNGVEKLNQNLMEFTKMVCHGEHTYLYSQSLMHLLLLEAKCGTNIKRLAQEIANFAQKQGHNATPILISLMGASSHPRVAQALSAMLSKNTLNPADITILYKSYQEVDAPPVEFLRVPQFLDLLLESLFKPGSKLHTEHRAKYVYLLAYAASVFETYKKPNSQIAYNNIAYRKSINNDELKDTIRAIDKVSSICAEKKGSSEILPELASIFELIYQYQVVAYGIVYWVKQVVNEASFFKLNTEQTPLHLALLDEVTSCHPTFHNIVLDLYIHIFESQHDDMEVLAQLELKKMILDRMIHLLSKNCVIPVLNYIKKCLTNGDTDISLIRYFITEVLSMVSPPYSTEFITLFLPLVECEEVTGNIRSDTETTLVNEFVEYCKASK